MEVKEKGDLVKVQITHIDALHLKSSIFKFAYENEVHTQKLTNEIFSKYKAGDYYFFYHLPKYKDRFVSKHDTFIFDYFGIPFFVLFGLLSLVCIFCEDKYN
jgi:hypothetical protein